ncbi:hypothetical protein [Streptomyces sp. NPDC050145]
MYDDLVRCGFTAGGPNRLWLTGITEHHFQSVLRRLLESKQ